MKNPATHEDEFNEFTRAVKMIIGWHHKVRLRNGTYAFPVWDEDSNTFFCHTEDGPSLDGVPMELAVFPTLI